METLKFNGKSVKVIVDCEKNHNITLLYNGYKFVVRGESKVDCIDTLHRLYPDTINDYKPQLEWFYPFN